jgi:uncharacterized membrane protein YqjE
MTHSGSEAHSKLPESHFMPLLVSMVHTRLALAIEDIEANARATAASLFASFAALVLGLVAFAFIGVAVVAIFWDTHRIAAALGATAAYLIIAALMALGARSLWASRPPALESLLRELALDREALRMSQ